MKDMKKEASKKISSIASDSLPLTPVFKWFADVNFPAKK
jgi:hypothetical protein